MEQRKPLGMTGFYLIPRGFVSGGEGGIRIALGNVPFNPNKSRNPLFATGPAFPYVPASNSFYQPILSH